MNLRLNEEFWVIFTDGHNFVGPYCFHGVFNKLTRSRKFNIRIEAKTKNKVIAKFKSLYPSINTSRINGD